MREVIKALLATRKQQQQADLGLGNEDEQQGPPAQLLPSHSPPPYTPPASACALSLSTGELSELRNGSLLCYCSSGALTADQAFHVAGGAVIVTVARDEIFKAQNNGRKTGALEAIKLACRRVGVDLSRFIDQTPPGNRHQFPGDIRIVRVAAQPNAVFQSLWAVELPRNYNRSRFVCTLRGLRAHAIRTYPLSGASPTALWICTVLCAKPCLRFCATQGRQR